MVLLLKILEFKYLVVNDFKIIYFMNLNLISIKLLIWII